MNKKNKGFTLIELIVVMAVIGILVLLAAPKFLGYTKKAKLTEIKYNIKQLENASEIYYLDKNEWPRLSDTSYTSEELQLYKIYDKTGNIISLDTNDKYYDIDYNNLNNYIKKPQNGFKYILQLDGNVYYVEDLMDNKEPEATDSYFTYENNGTYITITGYSLEGPKDVVIPSKIEGLQVKEIGIGAFLGNQLTSVTIPDSVNSIGGLAFYENQLTSVTIPNSVTSIGDSAFNFNQLTSVTIPNSVTTIEGGVFANNQLTSVIIPNSVTTIGNEAFSNNQLTSVEIPNSITAIGHEAFDSNQLISIVISNDVAISNSSISSSFYSAYKTNGQKAGKYILKDEEWSLK